MSLLGNETPGSLDANDASPLPDNIVHGTPVELTVYLVLNVWPSHFGLPLLVATILLSSKVNRHPTLVNMCVTWIIVGISASLLLYAGKTRGPEPSRSLCLAQASLIYAFPAMTSISAFLLVYQMFRAVRQSYQQQSTRREGPLHTYLMLVPPYIALVASVCAAVAVGMGNPDIVSRDRRYFYCSIKSRPLTDFSTLFAAVILLATLVFEVWTAKILWNSWKDLKRRGCRLGTSTELQHAIRTIAFGSYIIVAVVLAVLSVKAPTNPVPDLIIATAASVVCLIFGTQSDILRVWCFWRRDPRSASATLSAETPIKADDGDPMVII